MKVFFLGFTAHLDTCAFAASAGNNPNILNQSACFNHLSAIVLSLHNNPRSLA